MKDLSIFDIFKIGIGPSSSHTMGPWLAANAFRQDLNELKLSHLVSTIQVSLYGSLALTGKGHGTDIALMMGLSGFSIIETNRSDITNSINEINQTHKLALNNENTIIFNPSMNISWEFDNFLDYHSNAMSFSAIDSAGETLIQEYYYSTGGGFIDKGKIREQHDTLFVKGTGKELLDICIRKNINISDEILSREIVNFPQETIDTKISELWETMLSSIYRGISTTGFLPGGLNVKRRAPELNSKLLNGARYSNRAEWLNLIYTGEHSFDLTLQWISAIAIAVNEENADFGKVVTAPTNGAAGVVPAVLFYHLYLSSSPKSKEDIRRYFLVSGAIGILFKENATISAAMGGCQAEIGVSSAMAAAALTELHGGTPAQVMMAAEIAMEHHLGLTCDPIGGLVQIPCIERNSIGAIKAITASKLALASDPSDAKVSLDEVIDSMQKTAKAMHSDYKETSKGGLAITVGITEC